jgi:hypothetical protein
MTPRHLLAIAAHGVSAALEVVSHGYDASPLATHSLAERARDAYWLRADEAALADPEYAAIQERIAERSPGLGTALDPSGYRSVVGGELGALVRISGELTPKPLWWPLASFVVDRPVRRLVGRAEAAYQRATRGWADCDYWDLGVNVCATLAAQLNHLADSAWGWPGPPDYSDYDEWTAALRAAAAGLNGWASPEHSPAADAALAAGEITGVDYSSAANAEEEVLLAGAQDALRWVAGNLRDLWD